jgi:hypothetical protein
VAQRTLVSGIVGAVQAARVRAPSRKIGPSSIRNLVRSLDADRCRRKFLRFFPQGFRDKTNVEWERGYKWRAHEQWERLLSRQRFNSLLRAGRHDEVAAAAVRIEARTNLLFSFEKMALRDAVKSASGSRAFAVGLYQFLHGDGTLANRFEQWRDAVAKLPRKQTRVLTWPVLTVFGFIAQPRTHIFLKPLVTRSAAHAYGLEFDYRSRPSWPTYGSLLNFAAKIRCDLAALHPLDLIDIQSFIWVQGSSEYEE